MLVREKNSILNMFWFRPFILSFFQLWWQIWNFKMLKMGCFNLRAGMFISMTNYFVTYLAPIQTCLTAIILSLSLSLSVLSFSLSVPSLSLPSSYRYLSLQPICLSLSLSLSLCLSLSLLPSNLSLSLLPIILSFLFSLFHSFFSSFRNVCLFWSL